MCKGREVCAEVIENNYRKEIHRSKGETKKTREMEDNLSNSHAGQ